MINRLDKVVKKLINITVRLAQLALVFAMLVIVTNVLLRVPFQPIGGTVELVEMAGAILLSLGVSYTAMMKGHITVGILVDKLPLRLQALVDLLVNLIAFFFTFLLARELFYYALNMMQRGYQTGHLHIPLAPSIFLVAFGFVLLALVMLVDLLKAGSVLVKGSEN